MDEVWIPHDKTAYDPQDTWRKIRAELAEKCEALQERCYGQEHGIPLYALKAYRDLREEEKEPFKKYLNGEYMKQKDSRFVLPSYRGFQFSISRNGEIVAKDISFATVSIYEKRNRPEALVTFHNNISSVFMGVYSKTIGDDNIRFTFRGKSILAFLNAMPEMVEIRDMNGNTVPFRGDGIVFTEDTIKKFYAIYDPYKPKQMFLFVDFTKDVAVRFAGIADHGRLTRYMANIRKDYCGQDTRLPVQGEILIKDGEISGLVETKELASLAAADKEGGIIREFFKKRKAERNLS